VFTFDQRDVLRLYIHYSDLAGYQTVIRRRSALKEPLFVIFSDLHEGQVAWLEPVEGLANAQRRMQQIAAEKPGAYFVYDAQTASTVAKTNTAKELRSAPSPTNAARRTPPYRLVDRHRGG
jgi:hypothetical protein